MYYRRVGRVNSDQSVVLDRKSSYELTAFLVADALHRKSNGQSVEGLKEQDISSLISALNEYATEGDFDSFKDLHRINDLIQAQGLALPVIQNPRLEHKGDSYLLKWTFVDVFGREVHGSKKVSVSVDGKTQETSDGYIQFKTDKRDLRIEITQTSKNGLRFSTRHYIYPSVQVSLKEINMALTKGNERIKEYAYAEGSTIPCTQDNKLHIMFKINHNIDVEYSAFYLKHTENQNFDRIAASSSLTYNPDQSRFPLT
jgi:hypothetical protein